MATLTILGDSLKIEMQFDPDPPVEASLDRAALDEFMHGVLPSDPTKPFVLEGLDRDNVTTFARHLHQAFPEQVPERTFSWQRDPQSKTIPIHTPEAVFEWPTDFRIVTQPYNVNNFFPGLDYRDWGLEGHEGLDIRAPDGSNVYACFEGKVFSTKAQHRGTAKTASGKDHPYGRHVRLEHEIDGERYVTVYAHHAEVLVEPGEQVARGQLIAKADSTGNARGAHLHLTLKMPRAKELGVPVLGGTDSIIDPSPFLGL